MSVLDLFKQGDVFLDYPFEDMKFRYDKAANKVYARFYFKREVEIEQSDEHFNEAIASGKLITREQYFSDEVAG